MSNNTNSTSTPIWDVLTEKHNVHFDIQQHDRFNSIKDALNSSIAEFKCEDNMCDSSQLSSLSCVSSQNKIDLAQLLLTQYESSNLQYNEFMNRSCLLNELQTFLKTDNVVSSAKHSALNMFKNYLLSYNKYICKPLPLSFNNRCNTFVPYNDRIDIVLQYMMQFNRINRANIIKVRPAQFDIYFVPPNSRKFSNTFDSLSVEGMAYSRPDSRYHNRSGLEDMYALFCSETCKKLMGELENGKTRLILLIVRGNEYNTNDDILYLFTKNISSDLRAEQYENNEILWNLNSKKNMICNTSCADLLNISYHFHNNNSGSGAIRIYMYYNGFGERIFKRNIVNKLPFIFTRVNGKHKISNQILMEFNTKNGFNDCIETDKLYEFGKYLFGLNYQRRKFSNLKLRLLFNIQKAVLTNDKTQIREFGDTQNQLYYYLIWTCKMQVIDGEFSEYTLRDKQYNEIAIFNSELHEKYSNNVLYVICIRNNIENRNGKSKWSLNALMTSYEIDQTYCIQSTDLPIGSRHIHNNFQQEMAQNILNLCPQIIRVNDWNKVKIIRSQKYRGDSKPNFNKKNYDLNNCIVESIKAIHSNQNNLSLISILRIDTNERVIRCEALIPVKLPNQNIAVSYKTLKNKIVINALYIDPIDIINKAALVDANAINTYQYLLNSDKPKISARSSVQSVTDQSLIIHSLQEQLRNALKRETLMLSMMYNVKILTVKFSSMNNA